MEIKTNLLQNNLPKIRQRLPKIRVKSDIPQIKLEENDTLFNIKFD